MTIHLVEQGSAEWHAIRCGRLTASRVADALATTKTGWGASRSNLIAELVAERLTGVAAQGFTNDAMRWGTDQEPNARAAYEFFRDCEVTQVGFVEHPSIPMAGASPDGLVGDDGLVEIKAPNTATHIETLLGAKIPEKYILQMQFQMSCTERQWCDYVSYDPRLGTEMQLFVKRVHRDPEKVAHIEREASVFLAEVAEKVAALTAKFRKAA